MLRVFASLAVLVPIIISSVRADEAQVRLQLQESLRKYATDEAWSNRRAELRREFLKGAGLWPLPARPPVEAIVHSRREHGDYTVENVALETLPGFYCTGNLYRPLNRKDPGPVILCPHGHFRPTGRFREDQQIRCAHLARMGATVFSYSMVGWQDSQQTTHDDPLVLALQTWNSIRAVDYLTGLERVDAGRVAITGASGGGTQSMFLALVDDRVTVSAPLVIVYPWAAPDGCLCEGGLPVMQSAGTNAIEIAAATAPRPQLLISVGNDPTERFPEIGFPFIKKMYDVAGAADAVANLHLSDEGHDFGPTKRRAVYEFFAEHLRMTRNGFLAFGDRDPRDLELIPEDLNRIPIETPEQMAVFDEQHPLPKHALHGSDQIAAAFAAHMSKLQQATAGKSAVSIKDAPQAEYSFREAGPDDERLIFTPPGFKEVGLPKVATGANVGTVHITVRDAETGKVVPCRVNVVGSDGNYYEPTDHQLKTFSFTGVWPKSGWGNRQTKAPVRYFGRFFYTTGEADVSAPSGTVRIEVWKGFEYRPATVVANISAGQQQNVDIKLTKSASMPEAGYWSGDPHIHIQRIDQNDDERILDLLQAEDIHYGSILAYNEPAGPYAGFMKRMESPQLRGLGERSVRAREDFFIMSGQEYRSATFGHLNLFGLDELVLPEQSHDANNWPPYGHIGREARAAGGYSFYAHGGYAQEIYADVAQGNVDGVELLQFGVYRGIGLLDWYHMLNAGFRVPIVGASDYPACRKLGDCITFVQHEETPSFPQWLESAAAGRSFVSTGPLLLFDVDGRRPGDRIEYPSNEPQTVTATVRVRSEVAPVTNVQLIANGRILHEMTVPPTQGDWIELSLPITLQDSAWIAARAYSLSETGTPDAEAHTNPVYAYFGGKAPYNLASLDVLVDKIDGQIHVHEQREFAERAQVISYFERSRDILMKIREVEGANADGHPSALLGEDPVAIDTGAREHTAEELEAFLKPVPPKPIEEVLRSFETIDGFEMQLVAKEPLVQDPIAAAFDEDGNLYVCEMRDYPYKPQPGKTPIGSLRLLRDTDGDGNFDESHVFADELLWAGGVAPWKGGVFVAAPPDIWYLKDTDGDFKADVRERVFTGFGLDNQQAMVNNLKWGLDHKIYGSTAYNGGVIRPGDQPDAPGIDVSGRDFRFDPVTRKFETITGTVQFGNTFDDWGNRFLCSESQPLQYAVLPQRYLERNPYLAVPRAVDNIAPGPVPSFRISPLERWRQIRSSRRIALGARSPTAAGASHHVIDAAAGVTVYRGGAYPEKYYGNIFIGGAQNNLLHRRIVTPDGVTFSSQRADEGTEFVRSSDNWFRPVNFVNAPDGTLYVLDMSREILESIHVPLDVTKFIDFKHGREHGRIYRVAPPNYQFPGPPRPAEDDAAALVARLESPHGWWRDTAHRLIFERQDQATIEPLRSLLTHSEMPQARLHALWSLHGLNALTDEDLMTGLQDEHTAVRMHAMELAEPRLDHVPPLLDLVLKQVEDPHPRIQLQVAFSLGETSDPRAATALAKMAKQHAGNARMRTAVLSSSNGAADGMIVELLSDPSFAATSAGRTLIDELLTVIGSRAEMSEVERALQALNDGPPDTTDMQLVLTLGTALRNAGHSLPFDAAANTATGEFLSQLFHTAQETTANREASISARQLAIRFLGCATYDDVAKSMERLIDVQEPEPIQITAVQTLANYADPDVGQLLLDGWRGFTPTVRTEITNAMLARTTTTLQLLRAAEAGDASVAGIELSRRSILLKHSDEEIRTLAERLFGNAGAGSRADVITAYEAALSLESDFNRGREVFRKDCMVCHKVGDLGHALGPDLASSASNDAKALLVHVLDPNRYVLPKYEQYVCLDTNGRVITGMISEQSATSITLTRGQDKTDTILRGQIEELASTGKSLMPEGFEKQLSPQNMADLIVWLQSFRTEPKTTAPTLDIGTLPGLIEPDE